MSTRTPGEPVADRLCGRRRQQRQGEVSLELARAIGFDAVDAGPLKNARLLEPLAQLNIQLGYMLKLGTQIGFRLLRI